MNISVSQLVAQYETAKRLRWAPLAHAKEQEHNFPPFTLFAVFSRETNMGRAWIGGRWIDDYYVTHPGDNGNGHGLGQVDKRYHLIPPDWRTNLVWQISKSAEVLEGAYRKCGNWVGAFNAYNSGSCSTSRTTGKDYGPDVMERRQQLVARFAKPPVIRREDWDD